MRTSCLILTLLLAYVCLEGWARIRFQLQNRLFPFGLRANMGVNSYEAYKFKADFEGRSLGGMHYRTDRFGFRTGKKTADKARKSLILGGDSRIFGIGLDYERTVAGLLENDPELHVFQQAVPGSSPAFFEHDVIALGRLGEMTPPPAWTIYTFDRGDIVNDEDFLKEMAVKHDWHSPRRIKLALGGYFWNMANVKLHSYLERGGPEEIAADAGTESAALSHGGTVVAPAELGVSGLFLDRIFSAAKSAGSRACLVYLPRLDELERKDGSWNELLRAYALSRGIAFLDVYKALSEPEKNSQSGAERYFVNKMEGIHFNEKGCEKLAEMIEEWLEEDEKRL